MKFLGEAVKKLKWSFRHFNTKANKSVDMPQNVPNTQKASRKKIAIIGDGLASAICLDQLANIQDCDIDVFCEGEDIGRGRAYSSKTPPAMLLNYPVRSMQFSDQDGKGFLNYLSTHFNEKASLESFVSRKAFGDYVSDSISEVFNSHVNCEKRREKVMEIVPKKQGIDLIVDGKNNSYDDVIMCLGSGVVESDYLSEMAALPAKAAGKNIAVVGASLSGLDIVEYLFSGNAIPPAKITLLQRNPGFRMVRPAVEGDIKPLVFTKALVERTDIFSCDDLIKLIHCEFNAQGLTNYDFINYGGLAGSTDFLSDLKAVLERLSCDPKNDGDHDEFKAYNSMRVLIPALLQVFEQEKITLEEAKKFRDVAEKSLFAYLAPMSPVAASRLARLIDEGRVEIENGFDVNKDGVRLNSFDLSIDARGVNKVYAHLDTLPDILKQMVDKNLGQFSSLNGISYDPKNSRMRHPANDNIKLPYIIGQFKKGQQLDCSDSQVIYSDCKKVVDDIKAKLRQDKGGMKP